MLEMVSGPPCFLVFFLFFFSYILAVGVVDKISDLFDSVRSCDDSLDLTEQCLILLATMAHINMDDRSGSVWKTSSGQRPI